MVHTQASMYCVYKNSAVDAVFCGMPVGNNIMCVRHVCSGAPILNQCPYWCQHTLHYIGTYSVHTSMYQSELLFISCTTLYLVRTGMY